MGSGLCRGLSLALLLAGCSRAGAADLAGDAPISSADIPSASVGCQLMLWTKITARDRLSYTLTVVAENTTDHALSFSLPDACPNGAFLFEGLPDRYDYYQACHAGACANPDGPQSISLAVGERRTLSNTTLAATGGSCNAPLESLLYRVRVLAPPLAFRVCTEAASLDLRRVKIPKPPAPVAAPAAPGPVSTPAPNDLHSCKRSADCVIACPRVPGCCNPACGCQNAIRRDRIAAFEQQTASSCTKPPNCPVVACSYEPAYTAECRSGRCEPSREH